MAAKQADKDRRAKVAELQRQAKAAERRRTAVVAGVGLAIIVLVAGLVTYAIIDDKANAPSGQLAKLGVPQALAECDPVKSESATGSGDHVGPQTNKADITKVKYTTVPPAFGQHFVQPEFPNRQFYTSVDRPKIENLVHNLEHGYSILWYDNTIKGADIDALKAITREANKSRNALNKFIVSSWDDSYGKFPAGKHIAISHWSADAKDTSKQTGHRLLCGKVSGEAVAKFIADYPLTSAPEAGAQ
ncbi:MAG: DUF3105 domain-containing protein [Angustibacter sp.]